MNTGVVEEELNRWQVGVEHGEDMRELISRENLVEDWSGALRARSVKRTVSSFDPVKVKVTPRDSCRVKRISRGSKRRIDNRP